MRRTLCILGLWLAHVALPASAQDTVAAFYRGRTMEMLVSTTAGNDFDLRARLLARFMPDFIPGHPSFITRNMPGGGGIIAMNHMASRVPHDGATLHMMFPSVGTLQAIGTPEVAFDLKKFNFIGNTSTSPNVMVVWHTAGIASINALKDTPLILGTTSGDSGVYYVRALQQLGYKVSAVSGYAGGAQVNLAMERGEVQGRATNAWAAWKATKPDWVQDKKIIPIVQIGLTRHPDMPDVPMLLELGANDSDRALLSFLSASVALSRSLVTTPGVPDDRLYALRRAFDQTVASPQFLAEAGKIGLDISPLTGEQSQEISNRILDTPQDVVARARAIMLAP